MDLERGIIDMIDDYVAEALSETGTRKANTAPVPVVRAVEPIPPPQRLDADEDLADLDDLIPIEVELDAPNLFAVEEETAWMVPAFTPLPDPIPTLSRVRAARGSTPPQDLETEVELDDEITNLVGKPSP